MEPKRQCQGLRPTAPTTRDGHSTTALFDEEIEQEAEAMFQKVFQYDNPRDESWVLPAPCDMFSGERWMDEELSKLKVELNRVKSLLSGMEISEWHQHTQKTNKAGSVIQHVRHSVQPELCTQAWCKFGEILAAFRIGPDAQCGSFHSAHMCEAPGAFITCLNHFLRNSGYTGHWEWAANTLNPYYEGNSLSEMIHDDRFIFNTMDRWYFGADNTGDIMERSNNQGLKQLMGDKLVQLVTADGSVDCVDNPAEQESLVSQLHFCELVAALRILSPGGALVLKMFTMFEDSSACLLYLLNCFFEHVSVFKPACSKAGNSEVYVIAGSFSGVDEELVNVLMEYVGPDRPPSPMLGIQQLPESFLHQHRLCCRQFMDYQVSTIQSNLALFQQSTAQDWDRLQSLQEYCAVSYIERLQLRPIPASQKIAPNFRMVKQHPVLNIVQPFKCKRRTHGSFNQRQLWRQLPWQQRLVHMQHYDITDFHTVHVIQGGHIDLDASVLSSWKPVYGRPVQHIRSSPFCDADLLKQYGDFIKNISLSEDALEQSVFQAPFNDVVTAMRQLGQPGALPTLREVGPASEGVQHAPPFLQFCMQAGFQLQSDASLNCPCIHSLERQHTAASLLEDLLSTLKVLKPGDHIVYTSSPLFTRVSAGLVFLLYCCFKKVSMFTAEDGSVEHVYVAAICHTNCEQLLTYISDLETAMEQHSSSGENRHLLEFVPVQVLHEARFYPRLLAFNNQWLQQRMNHLLAREQSKLQPS